MSYHAVMVYDTNGLVQPGNVGNLTRITEKDIGNHDFLDYVFERMNINREEEGFYARAVPICEVLQEAAEMEPSVQILEFITIAKTFIDLYSELDRNNLFIYIHDTTVEGYHVGLIS